MLTDSTRYFSQMQHCGEAYSLSCFGYADPVLEYVLSCEGCMVFLFLSIFVQTLTLLHCVSCMSFTGEQFR